MARTRLAPSEKNARRRGATLVFLDETGFQLQPLNRRTWAPVGTRPVQRAWQRHDRLSVIGSLSISSRHGRVRSHFTIQDQNVRTSDVMRYLRALRRQHGGPLVVVLDRLNVHHSAVRRLWERGASWLHVAWLTAYAPDLNPVEALWSHTKYTRLANFVPDDSHRLFDAVALAIDHVYFQPQLLKSFFQAAKLTPPKAQRMRRKE